MEKQALVELIKLGLTQQQIADRLNRSKRFVEYWCSKHEVSTIKIKEYKCACGETDPQAFYSDRKIECKKCHIKKCYASVKLKKEKAVEYKGGKCERCSYDKCISALDIASGEYQDPQFGKNEIIKKINRAIQKGWVKIVPYNGNPFKNSDYDSDDEY